MVRVHICVLSCVLFLHANIYVLGCAISKGGEVSEKGLILCTPADVRQDVDICFCSLAAQKKDEDGAYAMCMHAVVYTPTYTCLVVQFLRADAYARSL